MDSTGNSNSSQQIPSAIPAVHVNEKKADSVDQVRKLGEKIETSPVPPDLRELLLERVARLGLLRASSGYLSSTYITEYEASAQYIDWVVKLPWTTKTSDILDLANAKAVMDKNHYGLPQVKDYILNYLSVLILKESNLSKSSTQENLSPSKAPILCLVGLAGTGKTTLAASIAESLGRKFERIPFGGMGDARALRGQSRAFPDAEPGYIIKKLAHCQSRNPVILLDELDRVSEGARSDIMGVLVELLDPEQNKAFTDHFVDYPFNLSEVLFIATSNNTTNISTAVLDRLEIIQMPSYSDAEKIVIAKSYLFPKIREAAGLSENQVFIDESLWPTIIRPLGYDSGIRSLHRTIDGMCRKVARFIVEKKGQLVKIDPSNVKEFLPTW